MIPKDEQLDLGTQPRYTRQWGYNASTGSTSMFRRFADVFGSGAQEETRLRNALRMQIGKDIASNYVSLAASHHKTDMARQMRDTYGEDLAGYDPASGRVSFNDKRPSNITYTREGGFDDNITKTTKTVFEYNKNYDDDTPTAGVGEPDTTNPAPKPPRATKKANPAPKKTTAPKPAKPAKPAEPAVDEDGIQEAEIIEDKPTTTVTAAPTPKKRTPRKGKAGAVAEDPNANADRPADKTLQ